ncbi:MAG TPA: FAD-dependent oxidoreductase [Candidatus Omnitrophota bacterium]|nr:FAD-dependent oxidoreductase [Candidatus Omnitrophota bacterium]HQO58047.1 FAD-dependent oxidoreductase [Candidatus Omnitrophota bacterium]HQP11293.1 FAD-dependent oxidoreductase [Candidatus Omnitrophota bacterium]
MLQTPQKTQSKEKRVKNFQEVCQGFSRSSALGEARRCPQCSDPVCVNACPLKVDIPGFIRLLREGDFPAALQKIKECNALPDICGRVCGAPCERTCILQKEGDPIAIRALERYAADHGRVLSILKKKRAPSGPPVAVIGSGAAGLATAYYLARRDFQVTVFESFPFLGGVLRYGIPEIRLPNKIVDMTVADIEEEGVRFATLSRLGQSLTIEDVWARGFRSVVLAVGTGGADLKQLPGHFLGGVYFSEEFLMKADVSEPDPALINDALFRRCKKVAVLGAGNKALDCARLCLRLGKDVSLLFPQAEEEMAVYPADRKHAREEGVTIVPLVRPLELRGTADQSVCGVFCDRMDYADPKGNGQWQLMAVPDSAFVVEADSVILAMAHKPNMAVFDLVPGLTSTKQGYLWVEELTMKTPLPYVYAAGDALCGQLDLVGTIASAQKAASAVENGFMKS